jgi:hypothetical protein
MQQRAHEHDHVRYDREEIQEKRATQIVGKSRKGRRPKKLGLISRHLPTLQLLRFSTGMELIDISMGNTPIGSPIANDTSTL